MMRLREMKIKNKLAVTFIIVLTPFFLAGIFAVLSFSNTLKETSERELVNMINHLYRLIEVQMQSQPLGIDHSGKTDNVVRPTNEDINRLSKTLGIFKVGITGYPYVMNSKGKLIIHPFKAGDTIFDSTDSKGFAFIKEICERAVELKENEIGSIRYPWKNENEAGSKSRIKMLKYRYIRPWNWIIAVGSYEQEISKGLGRIKWHLSAVGALGVLLVILLTVSLNRIFTSPLEKISSAAVRMADGDLSQRVALRRNRDEMAALAHSFNLMADQICENTENLEKIIDERTVALRESRSKYRNLVENTADGILTADMAGNITFVNSGLERMLGISRKQILGNKVWDYYTDGVSKAREIMKSLRRNGNISNIEMELLTREGRKIPIRTSASLLRDSSGREQGSLGIFCDISAEKILQKELKSAQAQLIHSMKIKSLGELVSGVAHEINNPLMAASTMMFVIASQMCRSECQNSSRIELVQKCHSRISRIINHLKEFSGQTDFERRSININSAIENALMIIGQQLLNMGINIEKNLASDLPKVNCDTNRMEQVFLDLFANARDAMKDQDGIKVLGVKSNISNINGSPIVAVEITDTGPGIPHEIRGKIFDPFFTTKEVGKGTGLGLSICYGIIEEHKGAIEIGDNSSGGANVMVKIPVSNCDENIGKVNAP